MPILISVEDAARDFASYVDRVERSGTTFILVCEGRPVAELSPSPVRATLRELPALLASLPSLTREDAGAFAGDLDELQREIRHEHDPWQE